MIVGTSQRRRASLWSYFCSRRRGELIMFVLCGHERDARASIRSNQRGKIPTTKATARLFLPLIRYFSHKLCHCKQRRNHTQIIELDCIIYNSTCANLSLLRLFDYSIEPDEGKYNVFCRIFISTTCITRKDSCGSGGLIINHSVL